MVASRRYRIGMAAMPPVSGMRSGKQKGFRRATCFKNGK
jgi:hypothetical protein